MYPVCARTLKQARLINFKFNFIYNILKPQLFDVTLRDGLQGLTKEQQTSFSLENKINLYHSIMNKHRPHNMEIGSIVSNKVLPIFKDTLPFLNYIQEDKNLKEQKNMKEPEEYKTDYYILVPNKERLREVINNTNINHFSFITSVSDSFQQKNTKMTLEESDNDILEMLYTLEDNLVRIKRPIVKLYVSCINECPIEGKIYNDYIVKRLIQLSKMNVDSICLSDTCGSLEFEDFQYIIENCLHYGVKPYRLSLHLHVKPGREEIIEKIIHKALDCKIVNFDVSMLEIGGCSVTMNNEKLAPNLSYNLFYKSLYNYMYYTKII